MCCCLISKTNIQGNIIPPQTPFAKFGKLLMQGYFTPVDELVNVSYPNRILVVFWVFNRFSLPYHHYSSKDSNINWKC